MGRSGGFFPRQQSFLVSWRRCSIPGKVNVWNFGNWPYFFNCLGYQTRNLISLKKLFLSQELTKNPWEMMINWRSQLFFWGGRQFGANPWEPLLRDAGWDGHTVWHGRNGDGNSSWYCRRTHLILAGDIDERCLYCSLVHCFMKVWVRRNKQIRVCFKILGKRNPCVYMVIHVHMFLGLFLIISWHVSYIIDARIIHLFIIISMCVQGNDRVPTHVSWAISSTRSISFSISIQYVYIL